MKQQMILRVTDGIRTGELDTKYVNPEKWERLAAGDIISLWLTTNNSSRPCKVIEVLKTGLDEMTIVVDRLGYYTSPLQHQVLKAAISVPETVKVIASSIGG
ncbi:hypothetical protein KAR91_18945 [Candidatus Pacearchaeota archaeon]|nr:hypothetical protein [Candidatus Pacearchaeota archaeon]